MMEVLLERIQGVNHVVCVRVFYPILVLKSLFLLYEVVRNLGNRSDFKKSGVCADKGSNLTYTNSLALKVGGLVQERGTGATFTLAYK